MHKLIIFTDLDGTLLDHDTYSFAKAKKALSLIKSNNIPLIIVTSKTSSEVFDVQKKLGISHTFIVENGGAVFFSEEFSGYVSPDCIKKNNFFVKILGAERQKILDFLKPLKSHLKIRSFVDFSDDELSKLMGMNIEEIQKSKKREFSEPFVFIENEKENFELLQKKALENGFKILKGGRFYHIVGRSQDKGEAVKIVKNAYNVKSRGFDKSIGIGDSMNDYEMLKQVDIPILVAKKNGTYENIHLPGLIKAGAAGPEGWNKVVLNYIL